MFILQLEQIGLSSDKKISVFFQSFCPEFWKIVQLFTVKKISGSRPRGGGGGGGGALAPMAPSLHSPLHHSPPEKCACAYYVHNVYVLVLYSCGSSLCQRLFSQELAYWLQKGTIITAGTCTHGGQLQLTLTNLLGKVHNTNHDIPC